MKYNFIKNGDSKYNATFITPWSFIHLYSGFFGIILTNYTKMDKKFSILFLVLIHTIYELKDLYFSYLYKGQKTKISEWSKKNSLFNSIGDTLFFILGIFIGINLKPNMKQLIVIILIFLILFCIFFKIKKLS